MKMFLRKLKRNKKKVLSFLLFLVLAAALPLTGYVATNERSFDDRSSAMIDQLEMLDNVDVIERRETDVSQDRGIRPETPEVPEITTERRDSTVRQDTTVRQDASSMAGGRPSEPEEMIPCEALIDCRGEAPYAICFEGRCVRGDVLRDGRVSLNDFIAFKQDFVEFKKNGWNDDLERSDFNSDKQLSMADYAVFQRSYRLVNKLD
jgi:hypothetical protein